MINNKNKRDAELVIEVCETARRVLELANKRGISDIKFTCEDKDVVEKYEEQKRKREGLI